jgi:hypothetical protein
MALVPLLLLLTAGVASAQDGGTDPLPTWVYFLFPTVTVVLNFVRKWVMDTTENNGTPAGNVGAGDWIKVAKGAGLAAVGSVVAYLLEVLGVLSAL